MNCENFNDRLPEYLDETLSLAEQTTAREHVQKCGACQQALARQEAFAKSIRLSFNRETQGLSLRPETRRNILNALKRPELRPTAWESIQTFFAVLWRQRARAGAVLLCLWLIIAGSHLHRHPAQHSSPQASAPEARNIYVIDVPIQTEMHVHRRQNNMVVDAVVTKVSIINASSSENIGPPPSSKPSSNQN
jgi:hypothetical protein